VASSAFDSSITWRIKDRPDMTMVELIGELTESSDLDALRRRLKGKVMLNLAAVRRVNSTGVREWVNFMRELTRTNEVTLTHCSNAIVTQLNMIYNFRGGAKVRSFLEPYICTRCDREEDKLIDVRQHFPGGDYAQMPRFTCDVCQSVLEFDEVIDTYLGFLREG
jgi:ABC-type transporter Mla MlaB component